MLGMRGRDSTMIHPSFRFPRESQSSRELPIATGIVRRIAAPVQFNPEHPLSREPKAMAGELAGSEYPCSQLASGTLSALPVFGLEREDGMITMLPIAWMIGLSLVLQVPPPSAGPPAPAELQKPDGRSRSGRRKTWRGWPFLWPATGWSRLGRRFAACFHAPSLRDGASRLTPLPEVVPPQGRGLASVTSGAGKAAGKGSARRGSRSSSRFASRRRPSSLPWPSGRPRPDRPGYAQAAICLREVLERQPDHPEARQAAGLRPPRRRLGPAVRRPPAQGRERQSSRLRLGSGGLGGPPRGASFPPPWSAVRRRSDGSPPTRPTGSDRTGRIPG